MKNLYTLLLLLLSTITFGQTYYWVGGSGDWSDLSHWATTSGGNTFHAVLPGPDNDVIIDENSFTEPGGVLNLDLEEAHCRNFDASAATNEPDINGNYYLDDLIVNGDLIIPASVGRDLKTIILEGSGNHIIELGGVNAGGLSFINHVGSGTYTQVDSLACANLYILSSGGAWISNGFPINAQARFRTFWNYTSTLNVSGSNIYTNEFTMYPTNTFDFSNTQIFISGTSGWDITAGGQTLPFVQVSGEHTFPEDISFGELVLMPGAGIELTPGVTVSADTFTLNGESSDPIFISTEVAGEEAFFSQASGTVDATWLVLQDNHATGGATFNAEFSVDNGNNTGWNIIENVPQTYYWVGGTGDWTDVTHWATTSGGAENFDFPPTLQDEVIFDGNSFDSANDVVTIEGDAFCASVDASAALAGATIESYGLSDLTVHGDFHAGSLNWDLSDLIFANAEASQWDAPSGTLDGCVIRLQGSGAVYLNDSIATTQFHIENGEFYSNGNAIYASNNINASNPGVGVIDFQGSNLYVNSWTSNAPLCDYFLGGSTFHVNAGFSGGNWDVEYDAVVITGAGHIWGNGSYQSIEILPDASLDIHDGATIYLEELIAVGTADNLIEIHCVDEGGIGTFYKESGEINVYFVDLKDNHATGGATFNAWSSVDNGNVEGWNIDPLEPADYFWVGGSGDWSDLNHWATTSGGAENHLVLPTLEDHVIFDANSFGAAGEAVNIDVAPVVASINASSAIAGSELNAAGTLTVKGSFNGGNMVVAIAQLHIDNAAMSTFGGSGGQFDATTVYFEGAAGVMFSDSISAAAIYAMGSHISLQSNPINVSNFVIDTEEEATFDVSNSTVHVESFSNTSALATFMTDGSEFRVSESFDGGNGINYNNITFIGDGFLGGSNSFNIVTIEPQASLALEIGTTTTIEDLVANGTEGDLIEITCATDGGTAYFSKSEGEVNAYYVSLSDNHAIGGATFNAWDSADEGNVEGWEFIIVDNVEEQHAALKCWPNPSSGVINLSGTQPGDQLVIFDMNGRQVYEYTTNTYNYTLDLSHLPAGNYVLNSASHGAQRIVIFR